MDTQLGHADHLLNDGGVHGGVMFTNADGFSCRTGIGVLLSLELMPFLLVHGLKGRGEPVLRIEG